MALLGIDLGGTSLRLAVFSEDGTILEKASSSHGHRRGKEVGKLIAIEAEAKKWAQPIAISQMTFEQSVLGGDAGLYGAGFLALKNLSSEPSSHELP